MNPTQDRKHRILVTAGMTLVFFLLFLWLYGYYIGRFRYQTHLQTISFYDLPPAFDGYKIVHFSDLHIGSFAGGHEIEVQHIADLINAQHPDAVVFTGDLINRTAGELEGFRCMLSEISAPDGVFSVLGNHDYALYSHLLDSLQRQHDTERLVQLQRSYGWTVLLNENVEIRRGGSHIYIAGVENQGYARKRFPRRANLSQATKGIRWGDFTILLSHDPTHWEHDIAGKSAIQLTLSGHTHAGQLRLFGWSPVSWIYPQWAGTYDCGPQVLSVSGGIGSLIPFRYGAWPEINVITLKRTPAP